MCGNVEDENVQPCLTSRRCEHVHCKSIFRSRASNKVVSAVYNVSNVDDWVYLPLGLTCRGDVCVSTEVYMMTRCTIVSTKNRWVHIDPPKFVLHSQCVCAHFNPFSFSSNKFKT
jgi:hypothetical protein